jgi:hypothetical protein
VDFDGSEFIDGSPCRDCQYEEPPGEWIRLDAAMAAYNERRERHLKRLYGMNYSDREIGEAVGMTEAGVRKWRERRGIAAHGFLGYEKWKDPEAYAEASRQRLLVDNPVKNRWLNGRKPSEDSQIHGVLSSDPSGPYIHW